MRETRHTTLLEDVVATLREAETEALRDFHKIKQREAVNERKYRESFADLIDKAVDILKSHGVAKCADNLEEERNAND